MNGKSIGCAVASSMLVASLLAWPGIACGVEPSAIVYTGAESEFVLPGSDLFSREDNGLPGDVYAGSLSIANESAGACEASLRIRDVQASGPTDMLERIPLMVCIADEPVFEGFLSEAEQADSIPLGTIEADGTAAVECFVGIPAELTNEYADAAVSMNVAVAFLGRQQDVLVPTGASLGKTGDAPTAVPFVVGACGAAGAVIWCAWKRRIRMW